MTSRDTRSLRLRMNAMYALPMYVCHEYYARPSNVCMTCMLNTPFLCMYAMHAMYPTFDRIRPDFRPDPTRLDQMRLDPIRPDPTGPVRSDPILFDAIRSHSTPPRPDLLEHPHLSLPYPNIHNTHTHTYAPHPRSYPRPYPQQRPRRPD